MSLSTLNWKRGLLRLWAVVSVLWVGVAFYTSDPAKRLRDIKSPVTIPFMDTKIANIPYDTSRAVLKEKLTRFLQNKRKNENPYDKYLTDYETAEKTVDTALGDYQPKSIWPPLFDFAKLAFIPPLFLLALGYIGLWVGRGFRR
jgi:uncharacterized protein YpmS